MTIDEDLVDLQPKPEDILLKQEQAGMITEVLKELPEHYTQALYLRYHQELSYKEIAVVLEVPVSRVKTYIHRGKDKMRQGLERRETLSGEGKPAME